MKNSASATLFGVVKSREYCYYAILLKKFYIIYVVTLDLVTTPNLNRTEILVDFQL